RGQAGGGGVGGEEDEPQQEGAAHGGGWLHPRGTGTAVRGPGAAASRGAGDRRLRAERAGDDHLLDLVGALADGEDLRVAVVAAHRVLLDVAVAAVDLDGLLGRANREAAGLELRLRA